MRNELISEKIGVYIRILIIGYSLMKLAMLHPGHLQNGLYFALYLSPLRWGLLFSPTKSVLFCLALDSWIGKKKILILPVVGLMFLNLRFHATVFRLQQCHNIYCQYSDYLGWMLIIFILLFPYEKSRSFLLRVFFIGGFWTFSIYHMMIIIAILSFTFERDIKEQQIINQSI